MKKSALGFTLIEMLVALAITAGIGVIAYRAFDGAVLAKERVARVTEQMDAIDRVWQYVGNDLIYAVPRQWQNETGTATSALVALDSDRLSITDAFVAGEEEYAIQFIRHNRDNVLDRPRSSLMMVGYRLIGNEGTETSSLWRDSWSPVDGTEEPTIQRRKLIDGITRFDLRVLPANAGGTSNSDWKKGWATGQGAISDLPAAVEVTLQLETFGDITRWFSLTPSEGVASAFPGPASTKGSGSGARSGSTGG